MPTIFIKHNRDLLSHQDFSVQFSRYASIHRQYPVMKKIIEFVKTQNLEFHTLARRNKRVKRLVFKAAPGFDLNQLNQFVIETTKFEPIQITAIKTKDPNTPTFFYSITYSQKQSIGDIKAVIGLGNNKVKWENSRRSLAPLFAVGSA